MYAIYISAARTRCEMVNTKKRERNFGGPHCYPMAGSGMVSRPKLMGPFSMTVPQLPLILAKCFLNSSPQPRERRKSTRIFWSTWISEQRKDRIAPRLSCVSIVNCKEKQTKIILLVYFWTGQQKCTYNSLWLAFESIMHFLQKSMQKLVSLF